MHTVSLTLPIIFFGYIIGLGQVRALLLPAERGRSGRPRQDLGEPFITIILCFVYVSVNCHTSVTLLLNFHCFITYYVRRGSRTSVARPLKPSRYMCVCVRMCACVCVCVCVCVCN
jgi:hypothetical protein